MNYTKLIVSTAFTLSSMMVGKSLVDVSVVKDTRIVGLRNNIEQALYVRPYIIEWSSKSNKKSLVQAGNSVKIDATQSQDIEVQSSAPMVIVSAPDEVMLTKRITEPTRLSFVQSGDANQGLGIVWMSESANLE